MNTKVEHGKTIRQGILFILASGIGFLINTGGTVFLHYVLGFYYLAAVLIALFSFYFVKFFVCRDLVFTNGKAIRES